jgi:hypothetical protein
MRVLFSGVVLALALLVASPVMRRLLERRGRRITAATTRA